MTPLVSIIIPVYNGGNYLREAIDSALAQTYKNIEILVVNDGSTDGGETERIALSYGDKIRYLYKENGGVSSALNLGIREMKGEYFSWLSHDDAYAPDKIKCQVEKLSMHDGSNEIVLCARIQIDKDSKIIANSRTDKFSDAQKLGWKDAVMYITEHSANGCALLIPGEAFEKCGMFDERLRYCQDILMWWKLFLNGYSLVFCEYVGVLSRVHDKQLTQTGSALYHHDAFLIGKDIIPMFFGASTKEYNFLFRYAKGEAIHGNDRVVDLCISKAEEKQLFSFLQKLHLKLLCLYGRVRPAIRQVYYRIVKKVRI